MILLNMAMVQLQLKNLEASEKIISPLKASYFGRRQYLYYGVLAEYY